MQLVCLNPFLLSLLDWLSADWRNGPGGWNTLPPMPFRWQGNFPVMATRCSGAEAKARRGKHATAGVSG